MDGTDGTWAEPVDPQVQDDLAPPEEEGGVITEELDLDGDGQVDAMHLTLGEGSVLLADLDGDGGADTVYVDMDGDGTADGLIEESGEDFLITDYTLGGETRLLTREELSQEAPHLLEALDHRFTGAEVAPAEPAAPAPADEGSWQVQQGQLIGDPVGDAQYWFQQAQNGFCLPASIAQIVAEYTGAPVADETAFIDIANDLGAFQVGYDGVPGIPFDKGVDILQEAGVPAELGYGSAESLGAHLSEGYNVIVFVDSGELWTGEGQEDLQPDHAVVVTGIDVERGTVILSDPGRPGGNVSEYPIDLFLNAWADSENAWIVADRPPGDMAAPADGMPVDGGDPVTVVEVQEGESAGAADGTEQVSGTPPLDVTEMLHESWADGLPGDEPEGAVDRATAWAVANPWIVIPVALLTRHLVTRARKVE